MMKRALLAFLLSCFAYAAEAATCTWTGGTGNWDNTNTASWSCAAVPGTGDTVVFDGTSGGGTVTVCGASSANCPNGAGVVTVVSISCGAFTGTLDFAANDPNVTLTASTPWNCSGSGTRTINLGDGTWTMTGAHGATTSWSMGTTTNLTFNANASTLNFTNTSTTGTTIAGGGLTYSTVNLNGHANKGGYALSGANTFGTLGITAPNYVAFPNSSTTTITNAFSWAGSSANKIGIVSNSAGTVATIAIGSGTATLDHGILRAITTSGGTARNATNTIDLGINTWSSITPPSATSGGICIGC